KCTFVAAPTACFLHLVVTRDFRRAARLALALLGLFLLGFNVMQWSTDGHFAFHMFGTHPDPMLWDAFRKNTGGALRTHWQLLPLAALFFALTVYRHEASVSLTYAICAFATALLTAAKRGSSSNHLLELAAVLTLCSAGGLAELGKIRNQDLAAAASLLGVVVLGLYALQPAPPGAPPPPVPPSPHA